ncbi:hypothetical protein D922_02231, partial [Enterococcus faecalis 06-MB-DW-09]
MARKVASEYAKVMFNEQAEITIGKNDKSKKYDEASAWVGSVFQHNDFKRNLSKYLEPAMALGGLVVRPYFNDQSERIEFSWALPDAFFPLESSTNKISQYAIAFKTIKTEGSKTFFYTLIEFHQWIDGEYWILNELYEIERPIFSYVKTAGFNNIHPYSPLGVGVFDKVNVQFKCKTKKSHKLNSCIMVFDEQS